MNHFWKSSILILSMLSAFSAYGMRLEDQYRLTLDKPIEAAINPEIADRPPMIATAGGGVVISMLNEATGPSEFFFAEFDAQGDTVWSRFYGKTLGEAGSKNLPLSISTTFDHGFIISGISVRHQSWYGYAGFLIRTDSLGKPLWQKQFVINNEVSGFRAIETSDYGFIVAGSGSYSANAEWYTEIFLIRTDSEGREKWRHKYPFESLDMEVTARTLPIENRDGTFHVFAREIHSFVMLHADRDGKELKRLLDSSLHAPSTVLKTADDKFLVSDNATIFKLDTSGAVLWRNSYPGVSGFELAITPDRGFFASAEYAVPGGDPFSPGSHLPLLIKFDASGNPVWQKLYPGGSVILRGGGMGPYNPTVTPQGACFLISTDQPSNVIRTNLLKFDPLFRFESHPGTIVPNERAKFTWSLRNNSDTAQTLVFSSQVFRPDTILPRPDSTLEERVYTAPPHSEVRDSASYIVPADWAPGSGYVYRGGFKLKGNGASFSEELHGSADYVTMEVSSEKRIVHRLDTLRATALIRNVSKSVTLRDLSFGVNFLLEDSTLIPDSTVTGSPFLMPVQTFTLGPGESRTVQISQVIPAYWTSRINILQAHLYSPQTPGGRRKAELKFVGEE